MAAPPASTLATFLLSETPFTPTRRFSSGSWFSIGVALAGQIVGKARKRIADSRSKLSADDPHECGHDSAHEETSINKKPPRYGQSSNALQLQRRVSCQISPSAIGGAAPNGTAKLLGLKYSDDGWFSQLPEAQGGIASKIDASSRCSKGIELASAHPIRCANRYGGILTDQPC